MFQQSDDKVHLIVGPEAKREKDVSHYLANIQMVDKTMAGIAREAAIGESGKVVKVPTEGSRGIVRFTTPLLGDDEWDFISEGDVELGDRVHIKDISGNTLIVVKLS